MKPFERASGNEGERIIEIENWLEEARKEMQFGTYRKSLNYSYDFFLDHPIRQGVQRFRWYFDELESLPLIRKEKSSPALMQRSTISTDFTVDFDISQDTPHINRFNFRFSDDLASISPQRNSSSSPLRRRSFEHAPARTQIYQKSRKSI